MSAYGNVTKAEAIKCIRKILGNPKISDKTILRMMNEAENSIMESAELNIRFTHGIDGKKKAIQFSEVYQKLFYAFIALRYKFDTFRKISRSRYDSINENKEKNPNISTYDLNRFIHYFDEYYFSYISKAEQQTLKKYLREYDLDDSLTKYESISSLMYEVACYLYHISQGYNHETKSSVFRIISEFEYENKYLAHLNKTKELHKIESKPDYAEFGNVYEKIYKAISKAIKLLFEQGLKSADHDSEKINPPLTNRKFLNGSGINYRPDQIKANLFLSNDVMFEFDNTSKNSWHFVRAFDTFHILLKIHRDIQVLQHSGCGEQNLSPKEVQQYYELDEPMQLTRAYRECYKQLVLFDRRTDHEIDFIGFVDECLDGISDMIDSAFEEKSVSEVLEKLDNKYIPKSLHGFLELYNTEYCTGIERYEQYKEMHKTEMKRTASKLYEENDFINQLLTKILLDNSEKNV